MKPNSPITGAVEGEVPGRFTPAPETEASRNDPEERLCVACGKPVWAHSCNRPPLGTRVGSHAERNNAVACVNCKTLVEVTTLNAIRCSQCQPSPVAVVKKMRDECERQSFAEMGNQRLIEKTRLDTLAVAARNISPRLVERVKADAELIAELLTMSWLWVTYHRNVEHGDYYECRICKGEGRPRVSAIVHTSECWISRAALAKVEGK